MGNKKILIIAYYWPPSGGSGVQRWLKFVKYLPQFGWKPYVFTPENPSFAIRDESLLADVPKEAEVVRFPIWEPYDLFFKISGLFGQKKSANPTQLVRSGKRSFFEKVSTWVRGNFFIPDPRIFWVKPSVKYLQGFLKANDIKIILTTSPPHSVQLIGYHLKKSDPSLTWIADFRDPWSQWGFFDNLMLSTRSRKKHRELEKTILTSADMVTTITPFYARQFSKLGNREVQLLTNGYDEDDFKNLRITRPDMFTIRHVGIVNEKCNPRPFMDAMKNMIQKRPEFADKIIVEFIGEVHSDFRAYVERIPELKNVTRFVKSIPHKELISLYGSSSVLLLVLHGYKDAEGYMPGKLFEYLATGLPIAGVGPVNGDAAALLDESGAGKMFDASDSEGLQVFLEDIFFEWKSAINTTLDRKPNYAYSRKGITGKLNELLEQRMKGQ